MRTRLRPRRMVVLRKRTVAGALRVALWPRSPRARPERRRSQPGGRHGTRHSAPGSRAGPEHCSHWFDRSCPAPGEDLGQAHPSWPREATHATSTGRSSPSSGRAAHPGRPHRLTARRLADARSSTRSGRPRAGCVENAPACCRSQAWRRPSPAVLPSSATTRDQDPSRPRSAGALRSRQPQAAGPRPAARPAVEQRLQPRTNHGGEHCDRDLHATMRDLSVAQVEQAPRRPLDSHPAGLAMVRDVLERLAERLWYSAVRHAGVSPPRSLDAGTSMLSRRRGPTEIAEHGARGCFRDPGVGNLAVGGTGKTQVVLALARQALASGRRSWHRDPRLRALEPGPAVDAHPKAMPLRFGDEPVLLARRLPEAQHHRCS